MMSLAAAAPLVSAPNRASNRLSSKACGVLRRLGRTFGLQRLFRTAALACMCGIPVWTQAGEPDVELANLTNTPLPGLEQISINGKTHAASGPLKLT